MFHLLHKSSVVNKGVFVIVEQFFSSMISASASLTIPFIKYLASEEAKEEKLLENQELFKTPVVRNGKKATLGYCPKIWKEWEKE